MSRTAAVLAALLALVLVMAACQPTDDEPASQPDPADEAADEPADEPAAEGERVEVLRLAGGDFGHPTPFAHVRGPGFIHAGYVFDTLLWWDSTGEPIGWLAQEWEQSDDGLEWRFTLRDDIEWHDGEPLTAEDVAFSFDYLTEGPAAGSPSPLSPVLERVDDVEAQDDQTVVFHLPEPFAAFEEQVAIRMFVLPEHIWSDVDDPTRYLEDDAFIGSGPYHLEEFDEAAESYLYTANDDFFLGAPVVQRLEFVAAPDELLALERGELHVAEVAREPVPDEQYDEFDETFGHVEGSGDWHHALHFNMEEGFPYDQADFRQAVAYAIDQQDMIDRLLFGRAQPGSPGGLAPDHPMHADDLPSYDHDLEQAEQLLDGLDVTDQDGDGLRDLPDGEPFQIELQSSSRFREEDPELVAEYLGDVGLDVEVAMLDRAAADEAAQEGNYEMALVGYGGLEGDPDFLRTRFHSEAADTGHSSVHGYENPRFDELAEQQLTTVDRREREDLIIQMQQILAEDLPLVSLYVPTRFLFSDEDVFSEWYYTPGCSPCRGSRNKHMHVTGQQTGVPD